jgi:hypothetical protein
MIGLPWKKKKLNIGKKQRDEYIRQTLIPKCKLQGGM